MSAPTLKEAQALRDSLKKAKRIVCICHRGPDGDAIGSLLGMGFLVEKNMDGPVVELWCVDDVPPTFTFLSGSERIQKPGSLKDGDVVITVDCAEPHMTQMHETHPRLFSGEVPLIKIDHHPPTNNFGTHNIVHTESASTCEIIVKIADLLEWTITPEIATALLTGVYTDTGGLLHSNTSAEVYRTVARLLRSGAKQQLIVTSVFRTAKISTLKLWGRVLEKISLTEEGGAVSAVTAADFRSTGADYTELDGAIDFVNAVPGMRFSMVLSERDGKVKGSLRTLREDVDVSAMASKLKGGGHKKAAGFAVEGKLQPEVRWRVIEEEKGEA